MVARTSSRQKPAYVPSSSQSTSSRLYNGCVVGLSLFLLLCYFWPKAPVVEQVQSNIEVALTQDQVDGGWFSDLLEEALSESLSETSIGEIVAIAAAAHTQTQNHLRRDTTLPVDEAAMKTWLRRKVSCREIGNPTDDYRLIELTGRGLQGDLAARLINQLATDLVEKLNQKLTAEQLVTQWSIHQTQIEDDLRYRRQWVEDLRVALRTQSQTLQQQFAAIQSTAHAPIPTRMVSTELQSQPTASLQTLELLLADIEMQQEQLLELANQHSWSGNHPEFQGRLRQIEQLQVEADRLADASPIPHLSSRAPRMRVEENEFYRAKAESTATRGQTEILDLMNRSLNANHDVVELEHEAEKWLAHDEQRASEMRQWIDRLPLQSHHQPLRIVEFARQPELPHQTLPAAHWLLMSFVAIGGALGWTLALNRRPSQFRSPTDVANQLGLDLFGVIPVTPSGRQDFLTRLKRYDDKIRVICETTILLLAGFIVIGLFREPRLLSLLQQSPFEGIAQALETFRHP
jgi:hypothetical protein